MTTQTYTQGEMTARRQIIITEQEDSSWFIRTNWLYKGNEIDGQLQTPRQSLIKAEIGRRVMNTGKRRAWNVYLSKRLLRLLITTLSTKKFAM